MAWLPSLNNLSERLQNPIETKHKVKIVFFKKVPDLVELKCFSYCAKLAFYLIYFHVKIFQHHTLLKFQQFHSMMLSKFFLLEFFELHWDLN